MSWTSGDVRLSAAAKRTTPPGIDSLALRRTFCPPRVSFIRGLMLASPSLTQGGSRMPESGPFGSVRGVCSNVHPYRDIDRRKFVARTTRKQVEDNCRKNLHPPIAIAKTFI